MSVIYGHYNMCLYHESTAVCSSLWIAGITTQYVQHVINPHNNCLQLVVYSAKLANFCPRFLPFRWQLLWCRSWWPHPTYWSRCICAKNQHNFFRHRHTATKEKSWSMWDIWELWNQFIWRDSWIYFNFNTNLNSNSVPNHFNSSKRNCNFYFYYECIFE